MRAVYSGKGTESLHRERNRGSICPWGKQQSNRDGKESENRSRAAERTAYECKRKNCCDSVCCYASYYLLLRKRGN